MFRIVENFSKNSFLFKFNNYRQHSLYHSKVNNEVSIKKINELKNSYFEKSKKIIFSKNQKFYFNSSFLNVSSKEKNINFILLNLFFNFINKKNNLDVSYLLKICEMNMYNNCDSVLKAKSKYNENLFYIDDNNKARLTLKGLKKSCEILDILNIESIDDYSCNLEKIFMILNKLKVNKWNKSILIKDIHELAVKYKWRIPSCEIKNILTSHKARNYFFVIKNNTVLINSIGIELVQKIKFKSNVIITPSSQKWNRSYKNTNIELLYNNNFEYFYYINKNKSEIIKKRDFEYFSNVFSKYNNIIYLHFSFPKVRCFKKSSYFLKKVVEVTQVYLYANLLNNKNHVKIKDLENVLILNNLFLPKKHKFFNFNEQLFSFSGKGRKKTINLTTLGEYRSLKIVNRINNTVSSTPDKKTKILIFLFDKNNNFIPLKGVKKILKSKNVIDHFSKSSIKINQILRYFSRNKNREFFILDLANKKFKLTPLGTKLCIGKSKSNNNNFFIDRELPPLGNPKNRISFLICYMLREYCLINKKIFNLSELQNICNSFGDKVPWSSLRKSILLNKKYFVCLNNNNHVSFALTDFGIKKALLHNLLKVFLALPLLWVSLSLYNYLAYPVRSYSSELGALS
ncbi:hypothetical protein [Candidatus Neptunichlamydia sp. REUL1]|uniref:hypothetical protein n=1 Tax=Candidatus Neptunichlamydia sp. REUL1 TaxID=3064277 RepID=UPI00293169D1|nr:hypothetical protein [Candidatus Neptunochlamydia sp. REUL1]